jgi:phthiodiolone/phenolphthiodiolone dimycocerosates ketoreductase
MSVTRRCEMAVNYWPSRFMAPQAAAEFASALQAAEVVDWFQTWDQLVSFMPQGLWRPEVTPTTTPARVALQLGAGELKQCKPFGYKRSQGLSRMEDIFQIVRKLISTDGLVSHEGNHWNYQDAWIGAHFPKLPELWALGGGPQLIDIATSYADGFMSMVPSAFHTPEQGASRSPRSAVSWNRRTAIPTRSPAASGRLRSATTPRTSATVSWPARSSSG